MQWKQYAMKRYVTQLNELHEGSPHLETDRKEPAGLVWVSTVLVWMVPGVQLPNEHSFGTMAMWNPYSGYW